MTRTTIIKKTNQKKPQPSTKIPTYTKDNKMKIAWVQTGSYGDNINSTLAFKPMHDHFNDLVLDVHTSTKYASMFYNNPYVNLIVEYQASTKNDALHLSCTIPDMIRGNGYNHILTPHPMYNPGKWSCSNNPQLGENLIFAWVRQIEELNVPYSLPLETVLRLGEQEERRAEAYFNNTPKKKHVLLEIEGESGQSFYNHEWALNLIKLLASRDYVAHVSCGIEHKYIKDLKAMFPQNVSWAGALSLRECAWVFNQCECFFSVSSGLSNVCNTNYCKKQIKWIEVVNSLVCSSAAIRKEDKIFWHENDMHKFLAMVGQTL